MTVIVPIYPRSPNGGTRTEHWSKKHKFEGQEKFLTKLMLDSEATKNPKSRPVLPVKVSLVLLYWGQKRDDDNLVASMKPVRDAVAKWLGVDDGDTSRVTFLCSQEKVKQNKVGTKIIIEPA